MEGPEHPAPPLDPPLFCMNARPHHGAFAKQNDNCPKIDRGGKEEEEHAWD